MSKHFNNLIEVLNDSQTRKYILEEISNTYDKKDETHENLTAGMPEPIAEGTRLRRTPWQNLQDKGLLVLPEIGYEFIRIRNKSSELPARERAIINSLVRIAIARTIKYYNLKK